MDRASGVGCAQLRFGEVHAGPAVGEGWAFRGWSWTRATTSRAECRRRGKRPGTRWTADTGWVYANCSGVRDLVSARAHTVVWIDLPGRTVMRQIVWRTVRRAALRLELWNGNRERCANMLSRDPDESVIAWVWHRHPVCRRQYAIAAGDPANAHLRFVRVRSRGEARKLLAEVAAG